MKKLFEIRNDIKKNKPEFRRQNVNRHSEFEGSWRRPRGMHSKLRRGFRGKWAMPAVGYSSPRNARGLSRSGLKLVVVSNLSQLNNLEKNSAIVISSNVGMKKKIMILQEAKSKNISVHAIKDVDKFLDSAKVEFENRRKKTKDIKNKRQQAKAESEKKEIKDEKPNAEAKTNESKK